MIILLTFLVRITLYTNAPRVWMFFKIEILYIHTSYIEVICVLSSVRTTAVLDKTYPGYNAMKKFQSNMGVQCFYCFLHIN